MTDTLEILNHMLGVVGESPVSSSSSNHPSALSAMVTLNRILKEFQNKGWWFNRDYSVVLSPNVSGEVIVPAGTLKLDSIDLNSTLVRRGTRMYDPVNHTYNIGYTVTVDLVVQLTVDELPEAAATYMKHKCAYDFYVADDGDSEKANRLLLEVNNAWAALQQEELRNTDVNALKRPVSLHLRAGIRQPGQSYNPNYPGGRT